MPSPIAAIDLITTAYRKLGAVAASEVLTADEAATGLQALNDVIETWNTESLSVPGGVVDTFTTVPGVASYTMGPGGTWGSSRPVSVNNAWCTVNGIDFALLPWSFEQYNGTPYKAQQGQIIEAFTYVNDFPQGRIYLYPTPQSAVPVNLDIMTQLTSVASTATVLTLPPAYVRALQYAVAVELWPEFGGNDLTRFAMSAKSAIKSSNRRPRIMGYDTALGPHAYIPARGW